MEGITEIEDGIIVNSKRPPITDLLRVVSFRLIDSYLIDSTQSKKRGERFGNKESIDEQRSVQALMDCNDKTFGIASGFERKSIAKLIGPGLDAYLFYGVTFKSPLFKFYMIGTVDDKKAYDRKKFICDYISWQPIDFTLSLAESMLNILDVRDFEMIEFIFATYADEKDMARIYGGQDVGDILLDKIKFIDWLSENYPQSFKILSEISDYKRFFLAKEFTLLCHRFPLDASESVESLYSEEMIVCMDWKDIKILYTYITTAPHLMAYVQLIDLKYFMSSAMKKESRNSVSNFSPLPELSFARLVDITTKILVGKTTTTNTDICAARIYDILKSQAIKGKHSYTPMYKLMEMMHRDYLLDSQCIPDAIQFLVDNGIIYVDDKRDLTISYIHEWEKAIILSFQKVMSNKSNLEPIPIKTESVLTTGGFELCDEQIFALSTISKNPITLIQGRAGSGKTDMLNVLAKNVHPSKMVVIREDMLATAFMAINVSQLRRIFKGTSFTVHQLLHVHNKYCCDSPYVVFDEYGNRKDTAFAEKMVGPLTMCKKERFCVFEKIEWLIIEELSTQDLALYSTLLASVIRCGNVKRIIMIGDVKQCPSIRCGDIFKSLMAFCENIGTLCVFKHDHRTSKANKILKANIDSILGLTTESIKFDDEFCIHIDTSDVPINSKINYINSQIIAMFKKWDINEYEHHVITRTNDVKDAIIRAVEKYFHEIDPITNHLGPYNGRGHTPHRKITFTENKHEDNIINNEILYITKMEDEVIYPITGKKSTRPVDSTNIHKDRGTSRFLYFSTIDGTKEIKAEWTDWMRIHLKKASASTVQSYQGSQAQTIFYVLPESGNFDTFENVVTAWTRSTYRIIYIGSLTDLYKAIRNPEPERRSKLPELLLEYYVNYKYQKEAKVETKVEQLALTTDDALLEVDSQLSQLSVKEESEIFESEMTNQKSNGVLDFARKMMLEPTAITKTFSDVSPVTEVDDDVGPIFQIRKPIPKTPITNPSGDEGPTRIVYRDVPHKPGLKQIVSHHALLVFLKHCVQNEVAITKNTFDIFGLTSSTLSDDPASIMTAANKFISSTNAEAIDARVQYYYIGILQTLNTQASTAWELSNLAKAGLADATKGNKAIEVVKESKKIVVKKEDVQKKEKPAKKVESVEKPTKKRKKEELSDDGKKKKKKKEKKEKKKKQKKKNKHDSSSSEDDSSDS